MVGCRLVAAEVEAALGSSDIGLEGVLASRVDGGSGVALLLVLVLGEELWVR